ncbi:MAG: NUDIX domain-containing protein [Clostridia bacterium]|nr:NUDIX domain-containing protein [Clostridia bacterium]
MQVKEKACGCIIVEDGKVLLIQQKSKAWGFPKGHVEFNEKEDQTAKREVKEETNLEVKIFKNKRYEINYITDKGNQKQVIFFLAKRTDGELKMQESEIIDIQWFEFAKAIKRLSYDNTRELLKRVIAENHLS